MRHIFLLDVRDAEIKSLLYFAVLL